MVLSDLLVGLIAKLIYIVCIFHHHFSLRVYIGPLCTLVTLCMTFLFSILNRHFVRGKEFPVLHLHDHEFVTVRRVAVTRSYQPGGRGNSYNGLYGKAPPENGYLFQARGIYRTVMALILIGEAFMCHVSTIRTLYLHEKDVSYAEDFEFGSLTFSSKFRRRTEECVI